MDGCPEKPVFVVVFHWFTLGKGAPSNLRAYTKSRREIKGEKMGIIL
jgi:hypothetical protein